MPPHLDRITPMVPVTDVSDAVAFFEQTLGFRTGLHRDDYAYVMRDGAAVRLLAAHPTMDMSEEPRQLSCYIDVTEIDALYTELKPKLDQLPAGRVRAPFDQPYGQREFHVIYEALLIFFGEPIAKDRTQ
jgi:catechol 2,3-dioxygenase-like lactoylglutathione lyase family enzyme